MKDRDLANFVLIRIGPCTIKMGIADPDRVRDDALDLPRLGLVRAKTQRRDHLSIGQLECFGQRGQGHI